MNQPATLSIRPSRPSIEIDGQRQDALGGGLMSLEILESEEGFARCELVFGNWGGAGNAGFRYFGRDLLEFGKPLRVKLGDGTLFDGRISAIFAKFPEGGTPQIGVFAEDRLQDLRMTRRTRAFADASLADVLRRIAGDHGLTADVSVDGETHKLLAQVNQSDLAYIRDLARREGAQVWVEGSTLKAAPRTRRGGEAVELAWAGTLREFEACADLAHQRTKVVAAGWSVADKRAASHEAGESAIGGELSGGQAGAAILQAAFGARVDTLAHSAPLSDAEARAVAEAQFRNRARRFVTARGVAETRDTLRVGAKVRIAGVGPLFEGDYVLTETHVRFEQARGLRTEFRCDRAAIGRG